MKIPFSFQLSKYKQARKPEYEFSILLTIFTIILSYSILPLVPVHTDTFWMSEILAGAYGEASAFVGFSNIILTFPLLYLQKIVPFVNMYNFFQVAGITVALFLFLVVIQQHLGIMFGRIVGTFFAIIVSPRFLINLQFTTTAAYLTMVGMLSLLYGIINNKKWQWNLGSALIFFIGYFYRQSSSYAVIPFLLVIGASLIFPFQYPLKNWIKLHIKLILISGAVMLTALTLSYVNDLVYAHYEPLFTSYNSARVQVNDYPLKPFEENKELYAKLGVSENDHYLMSSLVLNDFEVFTEERLWSFSVLHNMPEIPQDIGKIISYTVGKIQSFSSYYVYMFVFLVSLLLIPKKKWWYSFLLFFTLHGMIFLLALRVRLIERVFVCLSLGAIMATIYLFSPQLIKEMTARRRKNIGVLITAAVCVTLVFSPTLSPLAGIEKRGGDVYHDPQPLAYFKAVSQRPENIYFFMFSQNHQPRPEYSSNIFQPIDSPYRNNSFGLGDWPSSLNTPRSVLERYGVENPIPEITNKNAYVATRSPFKANKLCVFLKEHYDRDVSMTLTEVLHGEHLLKYMENFEEPIPQAESGYLDAFYYEPYSEVELYSRFVLYLSLEDSTAEEIYFETMEVETGIRHTYLSISDFLVDEVSTGSTAPDARYCYFYSPDYSPDKEYRYRVIIKGADDLHYIPVSLQD